jgi:hypothetical protein
MNVDWRGFVGVEKSGAYEVSQEGVASILPLQEQRLPNKFVSARMKTLRFTITRPHRSALFSDV